MAVPAPKRIAIVLNADFADWETGFVSATARQFFGAEVKYLTPTAKVVTSIGGMHVKGDEVFAEAESGNFDAIIVCGSERWSDKDAIDIGPALRAGDKRGVVIGVICAGTLTAARAGLFRDRKHTSNGGAWIKEQVPDYAGHAHYQNTDHAIRAGNLVSAPATAPASFAAEIIGILYEGRPELKPAIAMLRSVK